MNTIRTVLVDDERLARDELRTLLLDFPNVTIVGDASTATEAMHCVRELKPDLLLLDIEMPRMNGFELLEQLPPPLPHVIFTTAYDNFALQAFEVNALDYVLKPVNPQRLAIAMERARKHVAAITTGVPEVETQTDVLRESDSVFLRTGDRCWFVPVRSLLLLETEGNHVRVHFDDFQPLLYRTLSSMEERLPPRLFIRANRAQIINTAFIKAVQPWFSGSLKVTLQGGLTVEFSRRQAQVFRDRLGF